MTLTRSSAPIVVALVVAVAVALAGCGGGGGTKTAAQATTATSGAATTGTATQPPPTTRTTSAPGRQPASTQPSGSASTPANGGSEPAHTDVNLVGRGGRVTPPTVNVAPFVSVHVTLTTADGRAYRLRGSSLTLTVNAQKRSADGTLPGLRPGQSYRLSDGQGSTVVITSSGEPGP